MNDVKTYGMPAIRKGIGINQKHYTELKESEGYDRTAQVKTIFDDVRSDIMKYFKINVHGLKLKISNKGEHHDGSPAPQLDNRFAGSYVRDKGYIIVSPTPELAMKAYGFKGNVEKFLYIIIAHETAHYIYDKRFNPKLVSRLLTLAKENNFTTGYLEKENYEHKGEEKYDTELFVEYFASLLYTLSHKPFLFYHLVPNDCDIDTNGLITPGWAYKNNDIELFRKMTNKYRERICYQWKIFTDKTPKELTDEDIIYALNKYRKSKYGVNALYLFKYPPISSLGPRMKEYLSDKTIVEIDLSSLDVQNQIQSIYWGHVHSNVDNETLDMLYYRTVTRSNYFSDYDDNAKMIFSNINHIAVILKNGQLRRNSFKIVSK